MKVTASGATHPGRQRTTNEDALHVDAELGLFLVCDGLGGHAAGEIASRMAIEAAVSTVAENEGLLGEAESSEGGRFAVRVLVDGALERASRRLFDSACETPALAGMATTMTLLLLWKGRAVIGHVGDTRLYLLREGHLEQLTLDHTIAAELERRGDLSAEDAAESRLSCVLTRTIGGQPSVLVDTLMLDVQPGDTFLLCSDGLHRYFETDELARLLGGEDPTGLPEELIALANERGGGDNVTAVVVRTSGERPAEHGGTLETERARRRLQALGEVPFLRELPMARRARVLEETEVRRFADGELVLGVDAPLEGMYVVIAGAVTGVDAGRVSFGELALTLPLVAEREVRASGETELLFLGRHAFSRLMGRYPRLGCRLLADLLSWNESRPGQE